MASSEARQSFFVYLVGMAMVVIGGIYALWRIDLLTNYMQNNRDYVLKRDMRWEEHIKGQAELSREILRRLQDPVILPPPH